MHCPFPYDYNGVSSFRCMGLCVLYSFFCSLLYRNWHAMLNNVQYFTFHWARCTYSVYTAQSLFKISPVNLLTGILIYCVRGTRTQPLICVGCPVQLIREFFLRFHFRRRRRHTFTSLWGACLRSALLWHANSCGNSCVLGVHLSTVWWGLIFCQSFVKRSSFKKFAESS